MVRRILFAALGAAIALSSATQTQAVVACQKVGNPGKVKLRQECRPGKEEAIPLSSPVRAVFDVEGTLLATDAWTHVLQTRVPEGAHSVRASVRLFHPKTIGGFGITLPAWVMCELRTAGDALVLDNSGDRPTRGTDGADNFVDIVLAGAVHASETDVVSLWCLKTGAGNANVESAALEAAPM